MVLVSAIWLLICAVRRLFIFSIPIEAFGICDAGGQFPAPVANIIGPFFSNFVRFLLGLGLDVVKLAMTSHGDGYSVCFHFCVL